jgi:hypothetical protein
MKDGLEIRFWEDKWLGNATLREQYDIVRHKGDTIATVMETSPLNVTFKHDLFGPRLASWNALLHRLADVQLTPGTDEFWWNLHESGKFSVDSMHKALVLPQIPVDNNRKV